MAGGWDGSGNFTRTHNWQQDQLNNIKIRADRHDTNDVDFVNGINNCLTIDSQNKPTQDLDMVTNKHINVGNAGARDEYLAMGQFQDQGGVFFTSTGSANTYVLSPSPAITAYAAGQRFSVNFNAANTGASTINISTLGAKSLVKGVSTALVGGEISTNEIVDVIYDGTNFQIQGSVDEVIEFNPNLLYNSDFKIAQRGTTFNSTTTPANNDDTYTLDRWILLSDGNDIVDVAQQTGAALQPAGTFASFDADIETANKQFGMVQILENKDAEAIIGGTASLSFQAAKGSGNTTAETLRAAIISWDSTADVVTSDVVGTWAGAGTDPTLATNWTFENTPSSLTLTSSFQTFKIENISIDTASTTNVAVFIWLDDTDATVTDRIRIGALKLEEGPIATQYRPLSVTEDLALAQRYLPAINSNSTSDIIAQGHAVTTTKFVGYFEYPVTPRVPPTGITISNTGHFSTTDDVTTTAGTNLTFGVASDKICKVNLTTGATLTAFRPGALIFNNASGKLLFTGSEL